MERMVASVAVVSPALGLFAEPWPASVISFEPRRKRRRGRRSRRRCRIPTTDFNFTVDTADLGPGVYALTLLLDGKPADRTALNLVQGL